MNTSFSIAICSNTYSGYNLTTALDHIADIGYRYVELAAVDRRPGEHITQDELTPQNARRIRRELELRGLDTIALSAHSSLAEPDSIERFLPRLQFTADIGASVCNTFAGSPEKRNLFNQNLEVLLTEAEKLGVVLALEPSGDIITTAKDWKALAEEWKTPWLGLNYDNGNVFYGSKGKVDPVKDFKSVLREVKHLHIKDFCKKDSEWYVCSPGTGVLDTQAFINTLKKRKNPLPISIEVPYRLHSSNLGEAFRIADELPSLKQIDRELSATKKMIESALATF